MSDVTVELCANRDLAERRKEDIKSLVPNANWKTRIIENVATTALYLTSGSEPGSSISLKGDAEAVDFSNGVGTLLVIWTE